MNNEIRLGCKAPELEVGMEFSCDLSRGWAPGGQNGSG